MDVSNCTRDIQQNNGDSKQFESASDERLLWLETSFLDYLVGLKSQCLAKNFLTKETYEGLRWFPIEASLPGDAADSSGERAARASSALVISFGSSSKASNVEEESFLGMVNIKRRKSKSFTTSPTEAQTPIKRNSISLQQHARLPAHKVNEMRMLHEHKTDEEHANVELRCEGSRLKDVIKRKDREIHILKERLNTLQSVSYSDASSLALLQKNMEETSAQNQLLQEQVHSFKRIIEDYDTVIRQNFWLLAENRSLIGQLSYCDAKLRQHVKEKEAEKPPARGANHSLYSTPSLESIWSQHPLSSRQSRSSVTSGDEFKDSCCSCDEEQDPFSEAMLLDLSSQPEDPMRPYSELYRRNSMLPQHLKSVYLVETQQCPIPATPLKGDSKFTFLEIASTSAAAARSGSVQQAIAAEYSTKWKRCPLQQQR
ncbi:hypothetical protein HPB49_022944 [Dermacentor silvarum]|uniref:Uncharacterized protein n=1 Tax=Dermacentor silvarum TaxID=543639 RepID=A0ACB8E3W3_DERSI|nr:hypothetical protein HPB49_022944 [Dermacentor silvarum]